MKFCAYNDKLFSPNEFGSFTVVARKLNEFFHKAGVLGNILDHNTWVIYPEVFDTEQKWKKQIPYLACEYNLAPQIVIHKLKQYHPPVLSISDFAKNNLNNSGYSRVETVHLGTDPSLWYKTQESKFSTFTFLTVNSSNERSGYEKLIPSFIEFSYDKDVNLIIKDGKNKAFKEYIHSLNHSKIIYVDDMLSEEELRKLYNKSHVFLYTNNTTSFGMNPLDAVLCGTPAITTYGSALKEFIPEWTQPIKIRTELTKITPELILEWNKFGISCFPVSFLSIFGGDVYSEIVNEKDILLSLKYSFENYNDLLDKTNLHKQYILDNFTWDKCIQKIIEKVKQYD
jgi:glycosyltransferase involved in cell wall biosynthesis